MTDLNELLRKSREALDKMTPEEQAEMWRKQVAGIVRAEMSWPKPKYKWENGVKVYESYEDFVND